MKIARKFTVAGRDPFDTVTWAKRSSRITNPDGSVVFEMKDAWLPESWSQLAVDIMVSKYFRKAGVPQCEFTSNGRVVRGETGKAELQGPGGPGSESRATKNLGPERSAEQVIHRLAGCWRHWGETHGYFDTKEDAQAFYDELCYMMAHQMCAPNSPQWFNTGLHFAYGISGPAQGHWIVEPPSKGGTGTPSLAKDAYTHPQPHACFIQSIDDDLVNPGGIMDLWVREARLFKYGSGTGTNFSRLRGEGEKLSGGGRSSGLMSWLRIGDRAASAIKSGGTTRRAAKMVCLDMDHPDIAEFINWKVREEIKVQAMVEGLRLLKERSPEAARQCRDLKLELDYDFNGEAYQTVSGQNSNNSVRIPDEFFDALDKDGAWTTTTRTGHKPAKEYRARDLWAMVNFAAWRCADPGVQFDTTINAWHTCPSAGRINASNPCSEYMFLDNTACNLASLNVLKFYDPGTRAFDADRYEHAIDLWTIVLEISVLMAAFPSREIAELSYRYRTLGLGYANLGAMLMQAGIPYDGDEARAIGAMLTAILTGRSYRASALLAKELGPFPGFAADRDNMLRVIRNHRHAALGESRASDRYEGLRIRPVPIDHALVNRGGLRLANAKALLQRATRAWDEALLEGQRYGYRNAQVSVIAPTGTIGLLMDCDTTGVEPDFALVKFKKLAGGGYFKIANESVRPALRALGYSDAQQRDAMRYLLGALSLDVTIPSPDGSDATSPAPTLAQVLRDRGVSPADVKSIEDSLASVLDLSFAFGAWSLPEGTLKALGVDPGAARANPSFNLLKELGLTPAQIERLNTIICGMSTIEGAPHVKPEHLPVFDCANTCGRLGKRFIAPQGHIRMMAAVQPFISGAISKTINLPNSATVEDIGACYRLSWELGLKANALYRDGCKLSQPLSATTDEAKKEATKDGVAPAAGDLEAKGAGPTRELLGAAAEGVGTAAAPTVRASSTRVISTKGSSAGEGDAGRDTTPYTARRRRLPDTRRSLTHKFNVAGHEGYLTVGLYEDGQPGELFITMSKEGSTIGGLMDSLGTSTSVALQYGVPIKSLVDKFSHQRFEPAGMTENREIPFAKSLVDYIFRWMGMQFIPGYREQHAPKREPIEPAPAEAEHLAKVRSRMHDNDDADAHRAPVDASGGSRPRVVAAPAVYAIHQEIDLVAIARPAVIDRAMAEQQADAPACDVCGTITVRAGTCYKCVNCGNSMGCS